MVNEKRSDFLIKDLELKVAFTIYHFTSMWTRFNILISLQIALFVIFLTKFSLEVTIYPFLFLVPAFGISSTLLWLMFSKRDKDLAKEYREQIKLSWLQCDKNLFEEKLKDIFLPPGLSNDDIYFSKPPITARFSVTKIFSYFPYIVLALWLILFFMLLFNYPPEAVASIRCSNIRCV